MSITLRAYQDEALAAIESAEARGVRRQLGVAATGLGKTIMFTALARRRDQTRTLILAHRDELIDQAMRKVREAWPEQTSVGKVKAGDNQTAAHVVVASVQTLARERRLAQLLAPSPLSLGFNDPTPFGLVVVDEAHHASADSYKRILEGLNAGAPDGPLLVGVTATADRGDGRGLDDVFDEIVFSYDLLWGIGSGYLSDLRGLRVSIEMDLGKVKVTRGDYHAGQSAALLEAAGAPELIVKAWQEHAVGRRTLVFTPTVEMAGQCRDAFERAGVAAGWVHGAMDAGERAMHLRNYSRGTIDVLCNCAVLTEGYDEPRTDCIVIARPTKSRALYTQMVGRGTRLHPDKTECLVLDVVEASRDHSLVTIPSLFGLRREFEREMERDPTLGAAGARERQAELDLHEGRIRAEDAELFHKVRRDGLAWVAVIGAPDRRYAVSLGRDVGQIVLRQLEPDTDRWLAGFRNADGVKSVLARDVSLELAQGIAEETVRRLAPTARTLIDANAKWRTHRPSAALLAAAVKWRIRVDPKWNAGQVSDQINARAELSRTRRRR